MFKQCIFQGLHHAIVYNTVFVTTPSFYLLPLILLLQGATETIEKCFSDGTHADYLVYFVPSLKDLQVLIICRPCFTSGSSSSLTYIVCNACIQDYVTLSTTRLHYMPTNVTLKLPSFHAVGFSSLLCMLC